MATGLELDVTRFPLLVTIVPAEVDAAELTRHLEAFHAFVFARNEAYVSIIDATRLGAMPNARLRRILADYRTRGLERGLGELTRGVVIVSTHRLLATIVQVVEWAAPLPTSWTIVPTREEAYWWARSRLT